MNATTTKLLTFAEFEQLPDEVCRRHELRHGELKRRRRSLSIV
jgi:hypothetical protein